MYKYNIQVKPSINKGEYSNLANAIILQAVKDYRVALKKLKNYPHSIEGMKVKSDVERFFQSVWFSKLTSVDGNMLIQKLQAEVL